MRRRMMTDIRIILIFFAALFAVKPSLAFASSNCRHRRTLNGRPLPFDDLATPFQLLRTPPLLIESRRRGSALQGLKSNHQQPWVTNAVTRFTTAAAAVITGPQRKSAAAAAAANALELESSRRLGRIQLVAWVLAALLAREYWMKVPAWLQEVLLWPWKRLVMTPLRRLLSRGRFFFLLSRKSSSNSSRQPIRAVLDANATVARNATHRGDDDDKVRPSNKTRFFDDDDDDGSSSIVQKLQKVMALAQSATDSVQFEVFQMEFALLVMLKIVDQSKRQTAKLWDDFYESSGKLIFSAEAAETDTVDSDDDDEDDAVVQKSTDRTEAIYKLIDQLHLSDWAYLEETVGIRTKLSELTANNTDHQQWHLIRHVKTNEPGRVGHYVAVDSKSKVALIAVKGTSALSDMVTDACGVPVRYNLTTIVEPTGNVNDDEPSKSETTLLSCHEGILDASLALIEDVQPLVENLFLPSGYKVFLMGHSLGAGVACLVGTLLYARLPMLRHEHAEDSRPLLEVIAFAPPPMLNWDAAVATSPFTTSIVNNDDMIPRASLSNFVALRRFLAIVNARLEERGLGPTGLQGAMKLLKMVLVDDGDSDAFMTAQEIFDGLITAQNSSRNELVANATESSDVMTDMDHLFVPGKVIIVYEKHSQGEKLVDSLIDTETANKSSVKEKILPVESEKTKPTVDIGEKKRSLVDEVLVYATELLPTKKNDKPEVVIEAGAMITDGATPVLRHINVNNRMFSDHMPDAYEKTLRALL